MSIIKVLSPKRDSLLKVDLTGGSKKTSGVLYLNSMFEFCKVYAHRYGYPTVEVDQSLSSYTERTVSFGSMSDDVSFKVNFNVELTLAGVFVSSVVTLVHTEKVEGYLEAHDSNLNLYFSDKEVSLIEESVSNSLLEILKDIDSIDDLYKGVNKFNGSL